MFQRIQKLIRPRLRPHQLRPDDDPKDLIDYCQTHVNLKGVSVINSKLPLLREQIIHLDEYQLNKKQDGEEGGADENNTIAPLVNDKFVPQD